MDDKQIMRFKPNAAEQCIERIIISIGDEPEYCMFTNPAKTEEEQIERNMLQVKCNINHYIRHLGQNSESNTSDRTSKNY